MVPTTWWEAKRILNFKLAVESVGVSSPFLLVQKLGKGMREKTKTITWNQPLQALIHMTKQSTHTIIAKGKSVCT